MKKINFLFYLVLFFFVVNYVNAETLISDAGVEYDSKILDVLDNNAFVPIIIELNEFSDAEARNLLSIFDEDEIKNVSEDIHILKEVGLIEIEEKDIPKKIIIPSVKFDRLRISIPI